MGIPGHFTCLLRNLYAGQEATVRILNKIVEKEWVTGANARESHQAMNGERVPLDADFSNGQHWPGEDIGDPAESCGCNCTTEVVISRR